MAKEDTAASRLPDDCAHAQLLLEPSANAANVGYRDYTSQQLQTAAGKSKSSAIPTTAFPRPLVLPGDDLSEDPKCPGQSFRSWVREPHRNEVTSRRNVVYVAAPPAIAADVKYIEQWALPKDPGTKQGTKQGKLSAEGLPPSIESIEGYLEAFYTGMKVTRFSSSFSFIDWDEPGSSKSKPGSIPRYVGLCLNEEVVGIRARPSPDGMFMAQLNLNDILDAAISALPADAYALLLLVHQDLYEDEEDDFCCGRAYGGSRVAVVSSARYNPIFDEIQNVERVHAWPASHCKAYVDGICQVRTQTNQQQSKKRKTMTSATMAQASPATSPSSTDEGGPIRAAVEAHHRFCQTSGYSTTQELHNLWTARVCRTASHELGHCFGMGHCVYYACVMQSTASLAEDIRQPPYLCPVDSAKLLRATGATESEHYAAISKFCDTRNGTHMFAALGAWVKARHEAL